MCLSLLQMRPVIKMSGPRKRLPCGDFRGRPTAFKSMPVISGVVRTRGEGGSETTRLPHSLLSRKTPLLKKMQCGGAGTLRANMVFII